MEYIMINESKLKIILESSELEARAIESDDLDYANPDAKKLFSEILDEARVRFGFDTTGYRVLLQLYPSCDGGCELFVTRLGKLENDDAEQKSSSGAQKPSRDQKKSKRRKEKRIYRFERLPDICDVCRRLLDIGFPAESSAYISRNGDWYLSITYDDCEGVNEILPCSELSFISEYGYREDAEALSLYLCEYGRTICTEKAIESLGKI